LTHPFPQQQSLIAQNPTPPVGSNTNHPPNEEDSLSEHISMFNGIDLTTHTTTYDTPPRKPDKEKITTGNTLDPPSTSVTPLFGLLQIEKTTFYSILHPHKSTNQNLTFNPNSHVAQNYNIVEDLAQAPCTMLALEVLQHCPSQRRTLLESIGAIDPKSSNNITFNLDNLKS
jgi:hypothetical protein